MKLYYTPGACSLAVHVALREAGAAFQLVRVDLAAQELEGGGDFAAANPRGYVPVLELEDGTRCTEAAALLQHIADTHPSARLLAPPGARERLHAVQWLTFIATELHPRFGWLWRKDTPEATRKACLDLLSLRLAELDKVLGQREYLAGAAFSVADAYCFAVASWIPMVGMSLGDFPSLATYLGRIAARPAVRAALVAEGLSAQ